MDKHGVRPDPKKIKAITDWPVSVDVKELRKFLGLAAYLHKYSRHYTEITVHLSRLLKKNEKWSWNADCQHSFEGMKQSLMHSPILAIANQDRPFHVVCDARDFHNRLRVNAVRCRRRGARRLLSIASAASS